MDRLYSKEQIKKLRQEWKQQGRTVVFTNGCFDILHRGHVSYLNSAKNLGDILIVGLNSDESVTILKGKNRPLMPEEDRAYLLLNLRSVDAVVIFGEETPAELIRFVLPNILVKGGDYKPEEIVGKEIVEEYGGRVITIPLIEGKSTSGLVEKIKKTIDTKE